MANKQPFYHRAVILFTATREIRAGELQALLRAKLAATKRSDSIIRNSIEVEECDGEPGDPADLM